LEKKSREEMDVVVDGRGTKISYGDLNMSLRVDKTMEGLATKSISDLLSKWISPGRTILVQPVFDFGEDFEKRVSEVFPDRPLRNEKMEYNENTGQFTYLVEERKARVDSVGLQVKLISFSNTKKKPIMVEMVSVSNELEKKISIINKKLAETSSKPLELEIEGNKQKIYISPNQILSFLKVETKDFLESVKLLVDKEKVTQILASNGQGKTSISWTVRMIEDNLMARYNGGGLKPVVLGIDSGPNTDGSLADKYIEVDLSQQKMFFFEEGNLFKSYSVSTGLRYPTPVGSYKIQNKLPMGFSSIFQVWMPWWMAFDYREDIGAYLGIHELPYRLVGEEKIYRFGNYIGNRKTGGCVALSPGDSKEVYDKSFPGMDVVIYE